MNFMARRLRAFPRPHGRSQRKYPWRNWADGKPWEIRQGDDYDVTTENMRVNLHMKADTLCRKVQTRKISDDRGEGLVFQFLESDEMKEVRKSMKQNPDGTRDALRQLYEDALNLYERARQEVSITRKDGRRQKYAATRYKQQIEKGHAANVLVPTIARMLKKRTLGFGHLEEARRPDLMMEQALVLNTSKPYHALFPPTTLQRARERMADYFARHPRDESSKTPQARRKGR
jgi:hypothetical protein